MDFITNLIHEPTILVAFIFIIFTLIVNVNRLNKVEAKLNKLIEDYEKLKKDVNEHIEKGMDTRLTVDLLDKYMQQDTRYEILKNNKKKVKDKALEEKKVSTMLDPRYNEGED